MIRTEEIAKLLRAAAQPAMDLERQALEQIKTVCVDNAAPSCKHRMALDFVRKIASDCLAAQPPSASEPQGVSVPDGYILVPRELTAENGAKAALIGEFNEEFGCLDEDGEEQFANVPVTWTTIKAIHKKVVAHFDAAKPPSAQSAETAIAALAKRFWSIHPSTLDDMGLTREEFYASEMVKLFGALTRNEPQAAPVSDGAIYAAVSKRGITPEERRLIEKSIMDSTADLYPLEQPAWEDLTAIIRPMIESVCSDGNSDAARLAKDIADRIIASCSLTRPELGGGK